MKVKFVFTVLKIINSKFITVVNVSNAASSFTIGYVPTYMNGDNLTDHSDLVITSNYAGAFAAKVTP
ncbi:MAG TPA: hypothetical protein PKA90_11725 [Ignavibacteria bacterium]|nr:hypothetical protein [Ignavibacteria bacterium]HMR41088.1 hypothetical protein [Ignavibacteria bacterium]